MDHASEEREDHAHGDQQAAEQESARLDEAAVAYHLAREPLTLAQLRSLPDDVLVRRYDDIMTFGQKTGGLVLEPEDYLDELHRRAAERQRESLDRLNTRLFWFTLVAMAAGVVSAITAIIAVIDLFV